MNNAPIAAPAAAPLIVAYGMGVDSTAMLVGMQQRGERPDLIIWADTGDEKAATYAYLPVINAWLAKVGFPQVTVVKNASPKAGYKSLSESLLNLGTLPSPAYGVRHTCTLVWKVAPQLKFLKSWAPAQAAKARGQLMTMCIGFDSGPADSKRANKATNNNAPMDGCANRYPLREWGWDRARCEIEIAAAGLAVAPPRAGRHKYCTRAEPPGGRDVAPAGDGGARPELLVA